MCVRAESDGHPALIGYAMDGYGINGPLKEGNADLPVTFRHDTQGRISGFSTWEYLLCKSGK